MVCGSVKTKEKENEGKEKKSEINDFFSWIDVQILCFVIYHDF